VSYEIECNHCEAKFEITVVDYFLKSGEPGINYCPSCGEELE